METNLGDAKTAAHAALEQPALQLQQSPSERSLASLQATRDELRREWELLQKAPSAEEAAAMVLNSIQSSKPANPKAKRKRGVDDMEVGAPSSKWVDQHDGHDYMCSHFLLTLGLVR